LGPKEKKAQGQPAYAGRQARMAPPVYEWVFSFLFCIDETRFGNTSFYMPLPISFVDLFRQRCPKCSLLGLYCWMGGLFGFLKHLHAWGAVFQHCTHLFVPVTYGRDKSRISCVTGMAEVLERYYAGGVWVTGKIIHGKLMASCC